MAILKTVNEVSTVPIPDSNLPFEIESTREIINEILKKIQDIKIKEDELEKSGIALGYDKENNLEVKHLTKMLIDQATKLIQLENTSTIAEEQDEEQEEQLGKKHKRKGSFYKKKRLQVKPNKTSYRIKKNKHTRL